MICREIIKEIEARFPKHYAMEWDNVGLQVGRSDKEVKRIYLALDVVVTFLLRKKKCPRICVRKSKTVRKALAQIC